MIIGYIFTAIYIIFLAWFLASVYLARNTIRKAFAGKIDRKTIAAAAAIIIFFIAFLALYVHPVEQLYFDENIYQGIALNILHNGNALWCQYGSAQAINCPLNAIYHDPVEISLYLAMAFAILGPSVQTAYAFELAVGAISVFLVFLLGSLAFGKKGGVASALVFALLPELLIWTRTETVPDMIFMLFTILAFLCYELYDKDRSWKTFGLFLSALGIVVYMRTEAIILIPVFIVFEALRYNSMNAQKRRSPSKRSGINAATAVCIAAFIVLLAAQIYYIYYEGQNPNYGSGVLCGKQTTTFSSQDFQCNIVTNVEYFFGQFNSVAAYPTYFSPITTIVAIIGFAIMLLFSNKEYRHYVLVFGLWILAYHFFYDSFYAGGATFGVDSRFMLVIFPPIALFAGYGISRISDYVPTLFAGMKKAKNRILKARLSVVAYAILLILAAVVPFVYSLNIVTIPYSQMPQERTPLAAVDFIYNNTGLVPPDCLVFSFTPDVWYLQNRSAAQIGYFNSSNATFQAFESKYSCFVMDYGYWCDITSYTNSVCNPDVAGYNTTLIATEQAPNSFGNFSLYMINNYKK